MARDCLNSSRHLKIPLDGFATELSHLEAVTRQFTLLLLDKCGGHNAGLISRGACREGNEWLTPANVSLLLVNIPFFLFTHFISQLSSRVPFVNGGNGTVSEPRPQPWMLSCVGEQLVR